MVEPDLMVVRRLLDAGILAGPVLELGAGYGGDTCKDVVTSAGLSYVSTDLPGSRGVDYHADFEKTDDLAIFNDVKPFGTILVLNVLEHTFDPIAVLDNAITLLAPSSQLLVLTPSIWPIHGYPQDMCRLMPNFYEEYARRRGLEIDGRCFEFVGYGPVSRYRSSDGSYNYPGAARTTRRFWYGRVIHRVFGTFGRGMVHPSWVAIAALMRVPK